MTWMIWGYPHFRKPPYWLLLLLSPLPLLLWSQVFAEVRYGLAPSVVQRLDFEDIREGGVQGIGWWIGGFFL